MALKIVFITLLLVFCLLATVLSYLLFNWAYFLLKYKQKVDAPDAYLQRFGSGRYAAGCGGLFWSFFFMVITLGIVTIPGPLFAISYSVALLIIWKVDNGKLLRFMSSNRMG